MGEETYISNALIVVSITLIFIFLIVILIYSLSYRTTNKTTTAGTWRCPPQYCATTLSTGVKACSDGDDTVAYDPGTQVCNPRYFCTNSLTPYALNSDGGTNNAGVCETNVECACLSSQRCPRYISSVFIEAVGTGVTGSTTNIVSVEQSASWNGSQWSMNGQCTVAAAVLGYSTPGCLFTNDTSITLTEVASCMNLDTGCTEIGNNPPCARGTLAFITTDSNNTIDPQSTPMGCISMKPCDCNLIAVYNLATGPGCVPIPQ